jgi:hypothetical protein
MSAHRIATFNFEFWEGDPPGLSVTQIETATRVGTNGHTELQTGRWGQPFRARLTAHFATYVLALAAFRKYQPIVGSGRVDVIYNGLNFKTQFLTRYTVQKVDLISCQANVRLIGPGYNFPNGASLVTEWSMMPTDA